MSRSIKLFPDANFFFHCDDLAQIAWHTHPDLASFDEIHLMVCNPVHMEIDKHKYDSKGRIGRRARELNSILRALVLDTATEHLIREEHPRVILKEVNTLQPSSELSLDYLLMDHRILGCIHTFNLRHANSPGFFFTNDGSAVALAKNQNVPFVFIPDSWRMPPANNEAERRTVQLEQELNRMQRAEPHFNIQALDTKGHEVTSLTFTCTSFRPLTPNDISGLIARLKKCIPQMPSRFEQLPQRVKGLDNRPSLADLLGQSALTSRSTELRHRNPLTYERWIEKCNAFFLSLHKSLQQAERRDNVTFAVTNSGSRPGVDVLVELEAYGGLTLCAPQPQRSNGPVSDRAGTLKVPQPPEISHMGLDRLLGDNPLQEMFTGHRFLGDIGGRDRTKEDPNKFYYKPDRPREPVKSIALDCQQWRHGGSPEHFSAELYIGSVDRDVVGSIVLRVQAQNLSSAEVARVPVHIAVKLVSTLEHAERLVDAVVREHEGKQ